MAVNSNYIRARNKKTGVEVDLTPKAFEILRKQYELISGEVQEYTEKKTTLKSAEVVAPEIQVRKQILSPEEIAAKKDELQLMNQEAAEKVETSKIEEKPARKKPGPKPKINA